VIAAGLALVGGGGAALATAAGNDGSTAPTTAPSPSSEANAFLESVASHLGISVDKLKAAVKAAAEDRVDAALAAGRITKAQADALEQRIESGNGPFGLGGLGLGRSHVGPAPAPGGELGAAAKAIGVDTKTLLDALRSGKSIADVAKAHGVSVDKVEQAMLDAAQTRLDAAVKAGHLTSDQESTILARLKSGIDGLVNGSLERPGFGFGFRGPAFGFRHAPGSTA
jgi:hypothetical protein